MDLEQPYRLLFKPIEQNPPDDRSNEQERWVFHNYATDTTDRGHPWIATSAFLLSLRQHRILER